jgi:hypothetical protein
MIQRFCFAVVVLLATPCAWAAPQTHDGFFLQFNAGVVQQDWNRAASPGNTVDITGRGAQVDVSIGGAVVPNLILFGQISSAVVRRPKAEGKMHGVPFESTAPPDVSSGTVGIGAGLQYYIPAQNFYVAASALSLSLQLQDDSRVRDPVFTDNGMGFQFRVGKEWWVSEEWGLGAAISYLTASLPEKDDVRTIWDVNNFALTFSATYN